MPWRDQNWQPQHRATTSGLATHGLATIYVRNPLLRATAPGWQPTGWQPTGLQVVLLTATAPRLTPHRNQRPRADTGCACPRGLRRLSKWSAPACRKPNRTHLWGCRSAGMVVGLREGRTPRGRPPLPRVGSKSASPPRSRSTCPSRPTAVVRRTDCSRPEVPLPAQKRCLRLPVPWPLQPERRLLPALALGRSRGWDRGIEPLLPPWLRLRRPPRLPYGSRG